MSKTFNVTKNFTGSFISTNIGATVSNTSTTEYYLSPNDCCYRIDDVNITVGGVDYTELVVEKGYYVSVNKYYPYPWYYRVVFSRLTDDIDGDIIVTATCNDISSLRGTIEFDVDNATASFDFTNQFRLYNSNYDQSLYYYFKNTKKIVITANDGYGLNVLDIPDLEFALHVLYDYSDIYGYDYVGKDAEILSWGDIVTDDSGNQYYTTLTVKLSTFGSRSLDKYFYLDITRENYIRGSFFTKIGGDSYSITNNLENCTNSKTDDSITPNDSYICYITPNDGYVLSSVTVTMGGTDITSSVVSFKASKTTIYIDSVTDDVVINGTAVSSAVQVTNNLENCTSSNTSNTATLNDNYIATITADTDFAIDEYSVTMNGADVTSSVATLKKDKTGLAIQIYGVTGDIVVNVKSVTTIVNYTVTNNLTNCTTNNETTSVKENDSYNAVVTLTQNTYNDLVFDNITVTMGGVDVDVVKADDTFTVDIADVTGDIIITADTKEYDGKKKITVNVPNATNNFIDVDYEYTNREKIRNNLNYNNEYLSYYITFFGNENCYLVKDDIEKINIDLTLILSSSSTSDNGTIQHYDNTKLTYYGKKSDVQQNILNTPQIVDGKEVYEVVSLQGFSPNYTYMYSLAETQIIDIPFTQFSGKYTIDNELSNCTNDNNSVNVEYNGSYTATITADSDYYFESGDIDITMGGDTTIDVVISEDKTSFTIDIETVTGNIVITAKATHSINPVINKINYAFCNIYNPTLSELENISLVRFNGWVYGESSDGGYISISNFIYKIYRTYVKLKNADTKENVMLADYNTGVSSAVLVENPTIVSCGTIELNEEHNNVIDYSPFTSLQIYLPFIGIKDIDIDVCRNKTLKLEYSFDVVTGDTLATIYADNIAINQFTGSICEDIPYIVNNTGDNNSQTVTNDFKSNPYTMGDFTPQLLIIQNKGVASDGTIDGVSQYETMLLSDVKGNVQINNINLSTSATYDEKAEIINLLKQGVIIK